MVEEGGAYSESAGRSRRQLGALFQTEFKLLAFTTRRHRRTCPTTSRNWPGGALSGVQSRERSNPPRSRTSSNGAHHRHGPSARPLKKSDPRIWESDVQRPSPHRYFPPRLANNTLDCDAGGKVLRLKRFIKSNAGPLVINAVLDALKTNTKIEALYIQNFEDGFFDEQLERLTDVLKLKRIWCLNVGENFRTTLNAWKEFAEDLPETAVSHMYASEHHFIGTDLKNQMKDAIRETRRANVIPHSLEVIMNCGNMWYNPKLPKWAQDIKGGAAALIARQQAASADSSVCAVQGRGGETAPGADKGTGTGRGGKKMGATAAHELEEFLRSKRSVERKGKRTVIQTSRGAAFVASETAKQRRSDKLRRERAQEKKRDEADASIAEKNAERVVHSFKTGGGAELLGWRVRVWWPEEEAWFHGTVAKFDASSGRHGIEYEDGDEKEIALGGRGLSLDKIGFLRAPRGRGVGAKKTPAKKVKKESGTPARKSGRTPKRRAESPPPPPGGLRGSHGIRAAARERRLKEALESTPKKRRSSLK